MTKFPVQYPGIHGFSLLSIAEFGLLASCLPPGGKMLEVGSASGATAARISEVRKPSMVVCVDFMFESDPVGDMAKDGNRLHNWYVNRKPEMTLWLGDFMSFANLSPQVKFDLIFIDVDGPYQNVFNCLSVSHHMVLPGGVICIHDYANPGWPEVKPAVDEFISNSGYSIEEICGFLCKIRIPPVSGHVVEFPAHRTIKMPGRRATLMKR